MLSALPRLVLHHNGRSRLLSKYWDVAVHPVSWLIDLEKVSPWTSSLGQQQGRDSGCVLPRRLDKHFLWQANHSHRKEPLLVLGSLAGLTPQPRIGFFHALRIKEGLFTLHGSLGDFASRHICMTSSRPHPSHPSMSPAPGCASYWQGQKLAWCSTL